jgi:DNA-binding MarR family transcriptional regulator
MVQATKPRPRHPEQRSTSEDDLVELADALRAVMVVGRRKSPGSAHDKSVFTLLVHLISVGPLRASDLSERACLDLSTVSRHLRSLEDEGYVRRAPDPDDGRAQLLAVTPKGERLVRRVRAQRLAMLGEALDGWSDADRSELIRLTRRLAAGLENL